MDAKAFDKSKLPSRGGCHAHGDCVWIRGEAFELHLDNVKLDTNQKVVCSVSHPISATGGVVGLHGSLALNGAIVEVAGMGKLRFRDDAEKGTPDLEVSEAELEKRREAWKAPANLYQSGVLRKVSRKYADQVRPARKGAVGHAGGRAEVACYADI